MNLTPHKISREHTVEPLHQLLLNFGKGLWQWPTRQPLPVTQVHHVTMLGRGDDAAFRRRLHESTIRQVATMLRMQHDTPEDQAMIATIESLVLAGEIAFADFIGRARNLFPYTMDAMDVPLNLKVASLLIDA